ncbi:MAG: response regulator transcription factor [Saprospiraceae bacterium]|jgi:two-component system response regulator VicR|nr:response regulator transcription factor [Saprospiraceae bacterium]
MKILYIEDEISLARIVKESLQSRGFEVIHFADGIEWEAHIGGFIPDICLLDVMLPGKDGFAIAGEIRQIYPDLPVIFITAKIQTKDVLEGFEAGANDYIKKPFSLEELIVRLKNIFQLTQKNLQNMPKEENCIRIGAFSFFPDKLELIHGSETKRLSYREGQLLGMLCQDKNEVTSRKLILDTLWGDDSFFNSRNLDVYITKLRQYLRYDEKVQILTLKAVGYRLVDQ